MEVPDLSPIPTDNVPGFIPGDIDPVSGLPILLVISVVLLLVWWLRK